MFVNNFDAAAAAANVDKNRQNTRDRRQETEDSSHICSSIRISLCPLTSFFGQLNYVLALNEFGFN